VTERTLSQLDADALAKFVERPTARDTTPPDCPGMRRRSFVMAGVSWTVCEDAQQGALVFYGPGLARRVRAYPTNWEALTDVELYALSWRR
jgi:hypothetical protein